MGAKLILSTVAVTALMSATAFAQTQTAETDPRFMPRIYGSTAVTGVIYGQGDDVQSPAIQQPAINYETSQNTIRVIEPMNQDVQTVISAPITYSDTGVVKAQHFKQGDLSEAEYNALLEEADRIRAYQVTNENYTGVSYDATQGAEQVAPVQNGYEIELFAEPLPAGTTTFADTTSVTSYAPPQSSTGHTVIKGDTLYNISKRYAVTISDLQAANNISSNNIGLGQVLTIPSSTTIISENTHIEPVTMASSASSVTFVRNVEPVPGQSSGVYAVLPKDTLYSISRRACVKVADLISTNGISNPNALQPGQRLTMPAGHCLN